MTMLDVVGVTLAVSTKLKTPPYVTLEEHFHQKQPPAGNAVNSSLSGGLLEKEADDGSTS